MGRFIIVYICVLTTILARSRSRSRSAALRYIVLITVKAIWEKPSKVLHRSERTFIFYIIQISTQYVCIIVVIKCSVWRSISKKSRWYIKATQTITWHLVSIIIHNSGLILGLCSNCYYIQVNNHLFPSYFALELLVVSI